MKSKELTVLETILIFVAVGVIVEIISAVILRNIQQQK